MTMRRRMTHTAGVIACDGMPSFLVLNLVSAAALHSSRGCGAAGGRHLGTVALNIAVGIELRYRIT